MQPDINRYNPEKFKNYFVTTELYKKLQKDHEFLTFGHALSDMWPADITTRQSIACGHFSVIAFYYLEFLTNQNPSVIYDLGCGWNIFKKYIPNIIGIGEEDPKSQYYFGDIHGRVDQNYVEQHQNYFESLFSINALHFRPLRELRQIALEFISMMKPDSYGFLAINLSRMYERDYEKFKNYSQEEIENFVRGKLSDLPVDYKVFEINLTPAWRLDSDMDGNIRLVVHKTVDYGSLALKI